MHNRLADSAKSRQQLSVTGHQVQWISVPLLRDRIPYPATRRVDFDPLIRLRAGHSLQDLLRGLSADPNSQGNGEGSSYTNFVKASLKMCRESTGAS